MSEFNQFIKSVLRRWGVEIHRRKPYGSDLNADIANILGAQQPVVAFDVGANEGQTALAFSRLLPRARIHSFEPNPEAFKILAKNVAGETRVVPHQIALGRQTGQSTMYLTRSSLTSSMLPASRQAVGFLGDLVDSAGQVEVAVSTVDEFLREQKLPFLDLLKLDVQGFELDVLAGAEASLRDHRVALIQIEVNFVQLYERQAFFQDIYAELLRRNFRLVGLYHGDYRSGPFLAWCDALFVDLEALPGRQTSTTPGRPPHA